MLKNLFVNMLICCIATTLILFASGMTFAQDEAETERAGAYLQRTFQGEGMPLFTGHVWQKASRDEKVAFIWGASHVVTIEQALMAEFEQLRVENFSAKAVEGMPGVTMNEIVRKVDEFYAANPDKLEEPVIAVVWDVLIEPNINTGIAGRPIE